MNASHVSEQELHALVDGQLSPERAAAVAQAVFDDPALATTVAAWRQQNQALRGALDPLLTEPVPARLLEFASPRARWAAAERSGIWPWAAAACLVGGLAVGAVAGWAGRGEVVERGGLPLSFAGQAALIHATYVKEPRHPVEVWAAEEQHLVAWLSKRLDEPLRAPNLGEFGYSLVGGRLVSGHRRPAAMFMYQNADGQRITLVARRDVSGDGESGFRYAVEGGVGVFYWIDDDCGYAISGQLDKPLLLQIARSVYGQLGASAARPR